MIIQETIYLELVGYKCWEVDMLVTGELEPGCPGSWDTPPEAPWVWVERIEVTGARVDGEEVKNQTVLDWLDFYVNWKYSHGEYDERIENEVLEVLSNG